MNIDHVERMHDQAMRRIHDADLLSRHLKPSDSDAFLRILGFEILLKCAWVCCDLKPSRSHNYYKLWQGLPGHARKNILQHARTRQPGHTDFSNLKHLLTCWQFVVEEARYFYERYDGWTLEEERELGELWIELGAPLTEAEVQYHPHELISLIDGLSTYIKEKTEDLRRLDMQAHDNKVL